MKHQLSSEDQSFRGDFETCVTSPSDFNHPAHIHLAYVYLCEHDATVAYEKMKSALVNFLAHNKVKPTKYNETVTQAWILAVKHFMEQAEPAASATDFVEKNPRLLDGDIVFTHYTKEKFFSDEARLSYIAPDLVPVPVYA